MVFLQPNSKVFSEVYDYTWKDRQLDFDEAIKRSHWLVAIHLNYFRSNGTLFEGSSNGTWMSLVEEFWSGVSLEKLLVLYFISNQSLCIIYELMKPTTKHFLGHCDDGFACKNVSLKVYRLPSRLLAIVPSSEPFANIFLQETQHLSNEN